MSEVIPSLLKLLGRGFADDLYLADGVFLRWMFDPRLGFPRTPFCLERRAGVDSKIGQADLRREENFVFTPPLSQPNAPDTQTSSQIIRPGFSVIRPGSTLIQDQDGLRLSNKPVEIDFHGGSAGDPKPQACWVMLRLRVDIPNGQFLAEAQYMNRGEPETVDLAQRRFVIGGGNLPGLDEVSKAELAKALKTARVLRNTTKKPDLGSQPPKNLTGSAAQLYKQLLKIDPARFQRVTKVFLRDLNKVLADQGVLANDLLPNGFKRTIEIILRGDQFDRLQLTGSRAWLNHLSWVRTETLMTADGWKQIDCYPIATFEQGYTARNAAFFAGRGPEEIAKERVFEPFPRGVEPLDDPLSPPSRPPTDIELDRRYLFPWFARLEPWVNLILAESAGAGLHQSEVQVQAPLSELGQAQGDGAPASIAGQPADASLTFAPYPLLLVGASAFPVARLLGLGAVDNPVVQDVDFFDYRVRGRWDLAEVNSWGGSLVRKRDELLAELAAASAFDAPLVQIRLAILQIELSSTLNFLQFLEGLAQGGVVELFGLKIGLATAPRAQFAPPTSLEVTFAGLAQPQAGQAQQGSARLEWPLRARARVSANENVPLLAAMGRGTAGLAGRFERLLNPLEPELQIPLPFIPVDPEQGPNQTGIAEFYDNHVDDGINYRYGVAESDPFGRWSIFREKEFQWIDLTPPVAPAQVSASLGLATNLALFRLQVKFDWPSDLGNPAVHDFSLFLRRTPAPSTDPRDPVHWTTCERQAGTGAGGLVFDGGFSGTLAHDGMQITVAFTDLVRPDPEGGSLNFREYLVTLEGLSLSRDNLLRARIWAAIRTVNGRGVASSEVGGPALAEQILETPPPPVVFPPEPLQATFADADRLSSFTLRWSGLAETRYLVYRAGENELVQLLVDRGQNTSVYDPAAPANFRAAALRQLAPLARDAFQVRSGPLPAPPAGAQPVDWPGVAAGDLSFTDTIQGQLRTLQVYTLLGRSASGILSDWPANPQNFIVVAVPHAPQPSQPVIVRSAWKPPSPSDPERIEVEIARPSAASAPVAFYELYRTQDPLKAADVRRMRPIARLQVTQEMLDSPVKQGETWGSIADTTIQPWRTYTYRVIGRSPGQSNNPGMHSEASSPARSTALSALPPPPPVILGITKTASVWELSISAIAPDTPAGQFFFEIVQVSGSNVFSLARISAANSRQATPDQYRILVDETLFIDNSGTPLLISGDTIKVRLIDPLGQHSDSGLKPLV